MAGVLRQLAWVALLIASLAVTGLLVTSVIMLSWHAARPASGGAERLRSYYVAKSEISAGHKLRDEDIRHTYGYLGAEQPVSHKTRLVGRYAAQDIPGNTVLSADLVSVEQKMSLSADSFAIRLVLVQEDAVGIEPGDRIALIRSEQVTTGETATTLTTCVPKSVCAGDPVGGCADEGVFVRYRTEIEGESPTVALTLELRGESRQCVSDISTHDWRVVVIGKDKR